MGSEIMDIIIKIDGREVDRVCVRLGTTFGEYGGTPLERVFRVWAANPHPNYPRYPLPIGGVRHALGDGLRVLARKALDAMT